MARVSPIERGGSLETRDPDKRSRLSTREREVLAMLADGLTDKEIAQRLHLSTRTVSKHVGAVLTKLGARNRAHAAAKWDGGRI
jgi:DNA-binding NarL/FixJ family response regulator